MTCSATRTLARGPETWLRCSRPPVVPPIRADAARILAGVTDAGGHSAESESERQGRRGSHSGGDSPGRRSRPAAQEPSGRPGERDALLHPKAAVVWYQSVAQVKVRACHGDGEHRLPTPGLVAPDPFQAAVGNQLAFTTQLPDVQRPAFRDELLFLPSKCLPVRRTVFRLRSPSSRPATAPLPDWPGPSRPIPMFETLNLPSRLGIDLLGSTQLGVGENS